MTEVKTEIISREKINEAISYQEYTDLIDDLLKAGKTTGENHSESMIHYTKMNAHRMRRLDKQIQLNDDLAEKIHQINRELTWIVLTEAWCGDAAQLIPLINKMAQLNPNITLRFLMRDENLEIMDQFLTNGRSRSIPKLICIDTESLEVIGEWGPRPEAAQTMYDELRSDPDLPYSLIAEQLQKWYADDKTKSAQVEFIQLISEWS